MSVGDGVVLGRGTIKVAPAGTTIDDVDAWQELGGARDARPIITLDDGYDIVPLGDGVVQTVPREPTAPAESSWADVAESITIAIDQTSTTFAALAAWIADVADAWATVIAEVIASFETPALTMREYRQLTTGHARERKRDRKARERRQKQIDKLVRGVRRALQSEGTIR